jgi:AbrB family looped-hinge helix DNA binding protein
MAATKFQVTIPADARRALGLKAGRCLDVLIKGDRIELVPPVSALRGLFRGHSAVVEREDDRV